MYTIRIPERRITLYGRIAHLFNIIYKTVQLWRFHTQEWGVNLQIFAFFWSRLAKQKCILPVIWIHGVAKRHVFFKDQMHAFKVDDVHRYINSKSRPICLYRLINLILTHYACLFNFLTATIVKIKVARGSARVARLWRTFEILVPYVFTCGNYAFCIFTFGSNRSPNVRRILLIRDSLILN